MSSVIRATRRAVEISQLAKLVTARRLSVARSVPAEVANGVS